jgi:hypothetical protein
MNNQKFARRFQPGASSQALPARRFQPGASSQALPAIKLTLSVCIILLFFVMEARTQTCDNTFPAIGNTGIGTGTVSPAKKLHIYADGTCPDAAIRLSFHPNYFGHLALLDTSTVPNIYTNIFRKSVGDLVLSAGETANDLILTTRNGDGKIIFATSETTGLDKERMRIDPDGEIGINFNLSSSPSIETQGRFDINSHPWYQQSRIIFGRQKNNDWNQTSGDACIRLYRPYSGDITKAYVWWIENTIENNGSLRFRSTEDEYACNNDDPDINSSSTLETKVSFLRNGNVGIGVDNPQQKLVVDGIVCAREIRVSEGSGGVCGWPDFVFNDDYSLMSLEDLEKHIKINKHLPGIPSAEEIENNGLMLGETQKLMMQKIEELTLYIIELKKEINYLKSK